MSHHETTNDPTNAPERLDTTEDDFAAPEPTRTWKCDCGNQMERYRGQGDQSCHECGAWFNASGQRLRDDWMANPSWYDDEVDDLEGFELSQLSRELG